MYVCIKMNLFQQTLRRVAEKTPNLNMVAQPPNNLKIKNNKIQ